MLAKLKLLASQLAGLSWSTNPHTHALDSAASFQHRHQYTHVMTWPSNIHQSKRKNGVKKNCCTGPFSTSRTDHLRAGRSHITRTQAKASIANIFHASTVYVHSYFVHPIFSDCKSYNFAMTQNNSVSKGLISSKSNCLFGGSAFQTR